MKRVFPLPKMRPVGLLLTLALALLFGELLARVFHTATYKTAPPPARIDPYGVNPYVVSMRPFLFFHIPGARYLQALGEGAVEYRINAWGFRGPDVPGEPPPGRRRLLLLGDSVVEGAGVEFNDTFSQRLNGHSAGWEVINAAAQGASPIYFACNWERYRAMRPKEILLFLSDNDLYEDKFREDTYRGLAAMDDPAWLLRGPDRSASGLKGFGSALLGMAREAWLKRRCGILPTPLERLLLSNRRQRRGLERSRALEQISLSIVPPRGFPTFWALSQSYLDWLADACEQSGIRLRVATLNLQSVTIARPEMAEHARRLDRAAARWAERRGLPFLALAPALFKGSPPAGSGGAGAASDLVTFDAHLSAAGHAAAARLLEEWLLQNRK